MRAHGISKRTCAAAMSAVLATTLLQGPVIAVQAQTDDGQPQPLQIWFDEPVSEGKLVGAGGGFGTTQEDNMWQQLTLPIGNGSIGANVYGEISREHLTFNEKTLWNGGPSQSRPDYNGGNLETASNGRKMSDVFEQVQTYYLEGNDDAANSLAKQLTGDVSGYGAYQSWGDIYLDYGFSDNTYTEYSRNLDLLTAVSNVDFEKDGARYHREYFISYPDQVLAMRLTSESGTMDIKVTFPIHNEDSSLGKDVEYKARENRLTVAGQLRDNQMMLNGQVLVAQTGSGTVAPGADGQSLEIKGADSVIIYVAADTNYADEYPTYRTDDDDTTLNARVASLVDSAAAKGYDGVMADHLGDYKKIFDRVSLVLGRAEAVQDTTDELVIAYRKGSASQVQQQFLEALLFQYGRYLTIAASREGDLPSNLQGIWQNRVGDANRVPWGSDYHMNVNLQMNYWPTYSTNMLECATPLIDYINALKEPGQITAQTYFGVTDGGFTAHTQNTPFGWTCPGWDFSWGWSPAALPWILQNCYEYYEYSGDVDYLRNQIYPLLKESALLYDQILIEKDGRLVSAPAYSPEHGPVSAGNTYEQSLIWQLYEDAIHSAQVLDVDQDKVQEWKATQSKLNPIEIGDSGQIKEWYNETTLGSMGAEHHRHMSHLLGLFPGDLISVDNSEYMDAAVVSLIERGYSSTGWGVGQRINAWARTGIGDGAYKSIQSFLQESIYPNLWDSHPPFQIDGNFGYTSGVAEILLQSNMGYINILPSLPSAWDEGSVKGLVARGNFVVDIDWSQGSPDKVVVTSRNGGEAIVKSDNIAMSVVTDGQGRPVDYAVLTADRISFPTQQGESYTVTNIPSRGVALAAPENVRAERNDSSSVSLTWDAVAGENVSYTVYRQINDGDVIKTGKDISGTSFVDSSAASYLGTLKYQVQAVTVMPEGEAAGILSQQVLVREPVSVTGMVDDRDAAITYSGNWDQWGEEGLYEKTSTFVENPAGTETLEMGFVGTGLEIYATVNTDRGMADVYIDGVKHGTADSYSSGKANFSLIYTVDGLKAGIHKVKLHVTNTKNAASSKGKFEFDAFKILDNSKAVNSVTVSSLNGMTTLARVNSTLQMTASVDTVAGSDAVFWSAEPSSLAAIDENGLLTTGSASGTVTVTATSKEDTSKYGEAKINIELPGQQQEPGLDDGTITEFNVSGGDNNGGGTLNTENMEWTGNGWGTWGGEDGHFNSDKVDGTGEGDSVTISFTGAKIEIYGALNHTFSRFGVELDGVAQEDVDADRENDTKNTLLASYEGLEDGSHTLKLTVKAKDGRSKIGLDYFKVYQTISVPVVIVDKSRLQELIEGSSGRYPEMFTEESFKPFEQSYNQAVAVMNSPESTAEQIEAALTALEKQKEALVSVKVQGPVIPEGSVVQAKGVERSTLILTWDKIEGAVDYRVIMTTPDSSNPVTVAETSDTYARVSGLEPGARYYFTVEAVNRSQGVSAFERLEVTTLAPADITAPDPAADLMHEEGTHRFRWSASPSEDVVAYDIWVDGRKVASIDAAEQLVYDMSAYEDGIYRTAVVAVDAAGNTSVPCSVIFIKEKPVVKPDIVSITRQQLTVAYETAITEVMASLPVSIEVQLTDGNGKEYTAVTAVSWQMNADYDGTKPGTYEFTGEVENGGDYTNSQGLKACADVTVEEKKGEDPGPDDGDKPDDGDHDKPDGGDDNKPDDGDHNKPDGGDDNKPDDGDHNKPDGGEDGKPDDGDHNKPDGGEVNKPDAGADNGGGGSQDNGDAGQGPSVDSNQGTDRRSPTTYDNSPFISGRSGSCDQEIAAGAAVSAAREPSAGSGSLLWVLAAGLPAAAATVGVTYAYRRKKDSEALSDRSEDE